MRKKTTKTIRKMNGKALVQVLSSFLILVSLASSGQYPGKADKRYTNYEFSKAIPKYESILKDDSLNKNALENLGNCYRLTNQIDKAEQCYSKLVRIPGTQSIYKFYYAQTLLTNEKYAEAENWFAAYQKESPNDKRAQEFLDAIKNRDQHAKEANAFTVKQVNINTPDPDFAAVLYKEGIVFTSSRLQGNWSDRNDAWTGSRYTSLYYAKGKASAFSAPEPFAPGIQTKFNNGPVCFSKTGDEMYFTRNNIEEGKVHTSQGKEVKLKIFRSKFQNGQWSTPAPFAYNNDQYSCGHPALTADGTRLYFSSDMPGTAGGMDLWVCVKEGDAWGKPQNPGPRINTMGNEVFPTVSEDGTLYFSSNGLPGKGGLDLFSTTLSTDGYASPQPLPAPFNSPDDDFYMVMEGGGQSGYFSSNRVHQGLNDNIFSFRKSGFTLVVLVVDKLTNQPLDSSEVNVLLAEEILLRNQTGKDGQAVAPITTAGLYNVFAAHEGYKSDSLKLTWENYNSEKDSAFIKIPLEKEKTVISIDAMVINDATSAPAGSAPLTFINMAKHDTLETKTDSAGRFKTAHLEPNTPYRIIIEEEYCESRILDTTTAATSAKMNLTINLFCLSDQFVLKNIYYDLDKHNIRPDAALELDKLVDLLKRYPKITIELESHTDCRNTSAYNMKLSQNRANSAVAYIVQHGIDRKRLKATGYGESRLVNDCKCEGKSAVPCAEEQHQLNRRTEVKITSENWR